MAADWDPAYTMNLVQLFNLVLLLSNCTSNYRKCAFGSGECESSRCCQRCKTRGVVYRRAALKIQERGGILSNIILDKIFDWTFASGGILRMIVMFLKLFHC
jgi:hypothetical protein